MVPQNIHTSLWKVFKEKYEAKLELPDGKEGNRSFLQTMFLDVENCVYVAGSSSIQPRLNV